MSTAPLPGAIELYTFNDYHSSFLPVWSADQDSGFVFLHRGCIIFPVFARINDASDKITRLIFPFSEKNLFIFFSLPFPELHLFRRSFDDKSSQNNHQICPNNNYHIWRSRIFHIERLSRSIFHIPRSGIFHIGPSAGQYIINFCNCIGSYKILCSPFLINTFCGIIDCRESGVLIATKE